MGFVGLGLKGGRGLVGVVCEEVEFWVALALFAEASCFGGVGGFDGFEGGVCFFFFELGHGPGGEDGSVFAVEGEDFVFFEGVGEGVLSPFGFDAEGVAGVFPGGKGACECHAPEAHKEEVYGRGEAPEGGFFVWMHL